MPDIHKVAVAFIVDESGSMESRKTDVRGGFDSFIAAQRAVPGACSVSLTKFNDRSQVVFDDKQLADVRPIDYSPGGGTALYDAVGDTINALGARFSKLPEHERPGKVIVVIMTDGQENASQRFSKEKVQEMIKHQEQTYKWVFNFMGCGLEAMEEAKHLGIGVANSVMFNSLVADAAIGNFSNKVSTLRAATSASTYRGTAEEDALVSKDMQYSAKDRADLT